MNKIKLTPELLNELIINTDIKTFISLSKEDQWTVTDARIAYCEAERQARIQARKALNNLK